MNISPAINSSDETLRKLECTIEQLTKTSVELLRSIPIDERREAMEKQGVVFRFFSRFPFIGRGNVMRDKILDHDAVERQFEDALR